MRKIQILRLCRTLIPLALGATHVGALTVTQLGTFSADNSVFQYSFTLPTSSPIEIYTTSYGGGANLMGPASTAGGFVPVLTLFGSTGSVIASNGASGRNYGYSGLDPVTRMYDDAALRATLGAGTYTLTLTEFPNEAINRLSDGFLFASDPHATGNVCGNPSGSFLQSNIAPCVQRTANYALNVNTTPEPATVLLMLPAAAAGFFFRRRLLHQS